MKYANWGIEYNEHNNNNKYFNMWISSIIII